MAQSGRNIPATFPQPSGNQILKADAQRQISMLRQEMVTDLLSILSDSREASVRGRLIKLIEANLRHGWAAARRAEDLWPSLDDVRQIIEKRSDIKPAAARKHLKLFEQLDRVQHRSLALLSHSFENIRLILDRIQPTEPVVPKPSAAAAPHR